MRLFPWCYEMLIMFVVIMAGGTLLAAYIINLMVEFMGCLALYLFYHRESLNHDIDLDDEMAQSMIEEKEQY